MTDPVPPRKPAARKWLFWGCGCGGLVIVALASVFGYLLWLAAKGIDEVGEQGAAYLRARPELAAELGTVRKVERKPLLVNVQVNNDQGDAYFGYTVTGEKGTADAEVRLVKRGGPWQPAGAKLKVGEKTVLIGDPGAWPASDGKN